MITCFVTAIDYRYHRTISRLKFQELYKKITLFENTNTLFYFNIFKFNT